MSTRSDSKTADIDRTDWNELTAARKRLIKTAAAIAGPEPFERPELKSKVEESSSIERIIDDKERVLKTLKSTDLLNELVDAGYLRKTFQGGKNPIILDLEYDEERDTYEVVPFGNHTRLNAMATDVLDREGLSRESLSGIDQNDFNAVINAINGTLERPVLVVVSDPSKYRLKQEAIQEVKKKIE